MLATVNVCELPAPPEFVWPFYTDPAKWPEWTSDIEHANIDGPLEAGAKGRCKYRLLPEGDFCILDFHPPNSFTLVWTTLATHVRFEHELTRVGAHGCHVRERIDFHGLLSPILGLLERPRIRTHWPRSMDCLGALALESYLDDRGDSVTPTPVPVAAWLPLARVQARRPTRSGEQRG
jgi:Polyketide cyclase / dehydrase and lipid transport